MAMRRAAARNGESAQHFSNASCYLFSPLGKLAGRAIYLTLDRLIDELRFNVPLDTNRFFQRRSSAPIFWASTDQERLRTVFIQRLQRFGYGVWHCHV